MLPHLRILQRLLHHPPKVALRKTLRIKAMSRTMLPDQIMRQLMTHSNPPITQRINLHTAARLPRPRMQALEVVVIEEERAVLVEGDGGGVPVVEDVQGAGWEVEDGTQVEEDVGEGVEEVGFGSEEGVFGGERGGGEEDFDAAG